MWDMIFAVCLCLSSLLIAISSYQKWKKSGSVLYLAVIVLCAGVALVSFINPVNALFGLILPVLLYVVAGAVQKKSG